MVAIVVIWVFMTKLVCQTGNVHYYLVGSITSIAVVLAVVDCKKLHWLVKVRCLVKWVIVYVVFHASQADCQHSVMLHYYYYHRCRC